MAHLLERPAINWTACSLVEMNSCKLGGTPILKGTRMPAAAILDNHADGMSADEIADVFELPASAVRGLLSFAAQYDPLPKR